MYNIHSQNFLKAQENMKNINFEYIALSPYYNDLKFLSNSYKLNGLACSEFKILQEISYKCSGKCPYCMNKGLDYSEPELPVEEYIKFYKKIIDNGGKIKELRITGGEPFEPCNFERTNKLVEWGESKVKLIQINSNGYWEIPKNYSKNNIIIQFSLDGNEQKMISKFEDKNIFKNLINNCEFCKKNDIKFIFRSVIDDENDINTIQKIADLYDTIAIISLPMPVGGAATNVLDKDFYLKRIRLYHKYNQIFKENKSKCYIRNIMQYCDQNIIPFYINLMITPSGKIGQCAYLAAILKSPFNIYNFPFDNIFEFKKTMRQYQKDITCDFPQGFLTFWNSLTYWEKKEIEPYLFEQKDILPSIKDFYNIKE